ncbi:MAG: hypothetical protein K2P37_02525, partial [Oscillospiraceae bacterium]|nr:hypothetical protein [Oscillospiraceae bacterium]
MQRPKKKAFLIVYNKKHAKPRTAPRKPDRPPHLENPIRSISSGYANRLEYSPCATPRQSGRNRETARKPSAGEWMHRHAGNRIFLQNILLKGCNKMRIQHNIAAMNAYRNYNINTSAVSKNL